ncbi:P-loop NTPase [Thermodesulfobacteriota bacterium]
MTRIISITSGQNGAGRTNLCLNLALYLASQGHKTCIFDADMELANIDNPMGLYPELDLEDLITTHSSLEDIIITNYNGIDIIPGNFGVERLADLEHEETNHLITAFAKHLHYDFILIDLPAGISRYGVVFTLASTEMILVITPDPASLAKSQGMLQTLITNGFDNWIKVVVNKSDNIQVAREAYSSLKDALQKTLNVKMVALGTIIQDPQVLTAEEMHKPFITAFPDSKVSKCVVNIAKNLTKKKMGQEESTTFEAFWKRFFNLLQNPLTLDGAQDAQTPERESTPPAQKSYKRLKPPVSNASSLNKTNASSKGTGSGISADDIQRILQPLTDGLSAISNELSELKTMFKNGRGPNLNAKAPANDDSDIQPDAIKLDIEAFLKNRQSR